MRVPIIIVTGCVFGASGVGTDLDPASLLGQRSDEARTRAIARRLEATHAERPTDVGVTEALLRARKFLADGLAPDDGRSAALHRANVAAGVSALSELAERDFGDFDALLDGWADVPPSSVGISYWTTLSYGRTIPDRFFLARPAAARRFRDALERMIELDADFFHAGPLRALALFEARAPGFMGGDRDRAVRRAREAVRRAPDFAPNRVALARAIVARGGDRAEAARVLEEALREGADLPEPDRPEHRRGQAAARRMMAQLRTGGADPW